MLCWSKHSIAPRPDLASAWRVRAEAVVVQPAEIDALLEIDLRVAGRLKRPVPLVHRLQVIGVDWNELRLAGFFCHESKRIANKIGVRPRFSVLGRDLGQVGEPERALPSEGARQSPRGRASRRQRLSGRSGWPSA